MKRGDGGGWLIAASVLFWLSWTLMPGVGVTDTRQILARVALQRDAVWLSTALQLISAACFAPAIAGLVRLGEARGRRTLVIGAVLLAIGAMGSAADAIFHLLAYYMTEPGMELAAMAPLMDRMQGPGLLLLAPMLLAFFIGAAMLAVSAAREGIVTRRNPRLQAGAFALALAAPVLVRGVGVPPRAIGLTFLGLISASLAGLGLALAPTIGARRVAIATLAALLLVGFTTYLAGERTEVVVLHTVDEQGKPFATKMWVVDHDGVPWVRVANPERGWYRRLVAHPEVELTRQGTTSQRVAHPDPSPDTRRALDRAFAAKYGLTDSWYGALLRRRPVPIRLDPAS